jgi:phosphate transport system substrate-binding protein
VIAQSGCSSGDKPADNPAATGTPGKVVIKGSNTIGEELGPRLIVEFKKAHPAAVFELESKGTGYGLAGLLAGQCDLAAASRTPIKDELDLAHSRGIELNDYPIGFYSVAVIVQANCPVTSLTREQVRDIFTGAVQNWKDVGGPDAPIHLCIRDPISGTYLGFKELAMENKPYAAGPKTCTNYETIVTAVAEDPTAIGYSSIELAAKPGVKPLAIGGVAPSMVSVKEGKYPFQRALHLYSNKAKEAPAAHDFALFIQSAPGQTVLTESGFVPGP